MAEPNSEGFKVYLSIRRDDLDGYMERWILETPFGALRVHHILRSDEDRDLHDHPFDFWTLLLTNGYREVTEEGSTWYPRWSLLKKRAEDAHRLVLERGPVWTLVWTGPWKRQWGFHTAEHGWMYWKRYDRWRQTQAYQKQQTA